MSSLKLLEMSENVQKVHAQIVGRMVAERAVNTTDAEIVRTLKGCVLGHSLTILAIKMRDSGLLSGIDLLEP